MTVKDLYTDASKWTQYCDGRTQGGEACRATDPSAVSWCLVGAIERCYPGPSERLAARRRAQEVVGGSVMGWNDRSGRTFEEVLWVVNEAQL